MIRRAWGRDRLSQKPNGTAAARNAALIRARTDLVPRFAVVLGSGLGNFVHALERPVTIRYADLEDFPVPGVSGHLGSLVIGQMAGVPVAMLAGRGHYYEHGRSDAMRTALETLKALGAEILILTNAAGSVRPHIQPGSVMLIEDHINFANRSPLIGEPTDARFVGMTQAYDEALMRAAVDAAAMEGEALARGVYMWFSGPNFETPAEVRAAAILGADAVGMSTVPEVILARFLEMRVLAFSVITNFAAGMTGAELSHEETKAVAPLGGAKLQRILRRVIARLARA
jgi:purine-nucleoside phosphorylase